MTPLLILAVTIFVHGGQGVVATPASASDLLEKFSSGDYREVGTIVASVRPAQYELEANAVLEQLEGLLASLSASEVGSLESKLVDAKIASLCALVSQCPSGLAGLRQELLAVLDNPSISNFTARACASSLVAVSKNEDQRRKLAKLANENLDAVSKRGEREDWVVAGFVAGAGSLVSTCAAFDSVAARLKADPNFRRTLSENVALEYGQARKLAGRFRDADDLESKVRLLVELSSLITVVPYSTRPNIKYLNDRFHELLVADIDLVEVELRKALPEGPEELHEQRKRQLHRLLDYIEQHCKPTTTHGSPK